MSKVHPFKNNVYEKWLDYETDFVPVPASASEVVEEKTDAEEARDLKRLELKKYKGVDPNVKAEKKAEAERIKAEKKAEQERLKAEKNDAIIKINQLRTDLTAKQKTQKKQATITLDILNTYAEQIDQLQLPPQIYDLIKKDAEEEAAIATRTQEILKQQELEKERKKAEKMAYESSPEGIAEKARKEEERIQKEREMEEQLAREREEKIQREKAMEEEKQAKIVELDSLLVQLKEEYENMPKENRKERVALKKRMAEAESQLSKLKRKRGGNITHKNKKYKKYYKHNSKKMVSKKSYKLTKKHSKAIKHSKNTKKRL
jgi:hypothetical protein